MRSTDRFSKQTPEMDACWASDYKGRTITKRPRYVSPRGLFIMWKRVPDSHPLFRRNIHLVTGLHAESFIEARLIDQRAIGTELARRMGIGLDQHDLLLVAYLGTPDLRKAHVEALVARQTVDHRRRFATQRQLVSLIGDGQTGVIGDVFTQRQRTMDVIAFDGAVSVVLLDQRIGLQL